MTFENVFVKSMIILQSAVKSLSTLKNNFTIIKAKNGSTTQGYSYFLQIQ